jgi:hypothetical protein
MLPLSNTCSPSATACEVCCRPRADATSPTTEIEPEAATPFPDTSTEAMASNANLRSWALSRGPSSAEPEEGTFRTWVAGDAGWAAASVATRRASPVNPVRVEPWHVPT